MRTRRCATLFLRMGIPRGCVDNSMNPETASGEAASRSARPLPELLPSDVFYRSGLAAVRTVSSSTLARISVLDD